MVFSQIFAEVAYHTIDGFGKQVDKSLLAINLLRHTSVGGAIPFPPLCVYFIWSNSIIMYSLLCIMKYMMYVTMRTEE